MKTDPQPEDGHTHKRGDEEDCSSLGTNDESYSVSNDGDSNAGPRELVHRETRWVFYSKIVVLGVILLATAVSTAGAYIYTERNIEDNFKSEFKVYGREILEVSQATAANLFDTITSMSITITSYALATNSTFPFVTIPHFGIRGRQLLELSGSDSMAFCPLVKEEDRKAWERYSVKNQHWLEEDNQIAGIPGKPDPIYPFIFRFDRTNPGPPRPIPENRTEFPYYFPFWQLSPSSPFNSFIVNRNHFDGESFAEVFDVVPETNSAVLSRILASAHWRTDIVDWPNSYIVAPIYDKLSGDKNLAAVFTSVTPWHRFLLRVLPEGIDGIVLEIRNTCGEVVSYKVNGPEAEFLGWGELHDTKYEHLGFQQPFDVINPPNASKSPSFCSYTFHVFPSDEFYERFETDDPLRNALTVLVIFLLTTIVFVAYDLLVQRRQTKVMHSAVRTSNLVRSLFPEAVRDRIMDDAHAQAQAQEDANKKNKGRNFNMALFRGARNKKDFEVNKVPPNVQSKPIADLFPAATVMFADIAGFTAWSSVREPSQVFRLLEEIYNSFDAVAKGRKIFKVETIGDCYVAVAGLPTPRKDHAVAMARFATECVILMNEAVNNLEVELGPDTSDLACRFGLHSGPVTAGVLRGEKSRFQLFGDTVNVAGRMEQTGISNRVQVSRQTATCLQEAGKGSWVKPRDEPIFVKGKGEMRTFWLEIPSAGSTTAGSAIHRSSIVETRSGIKTRRRFSTATPVYDAAEKKRRLIDWNVDMLSKLLKKIVAMRDHDRTSKQNPGENLQKSSWNKNSTSTVLDEVKEVISLPNQALKYKMDPENVILDSVIMEQLKDYVAAIASLYRDNPFHSFEHASHVSMSVSKLLSRVVTPDSIDYDAMTYKKKKASSLHRYTYGITSDPITQFACAFSALIHDVDHSGVPNAQLIKENPDLAELYKNKSVAEQNSVDLAWELLMEPPYRGLLNCIAIDQTELNRFRQLVVNSVMATDIADKELGALRRRRWDKAFNADTISDGGNSRVSTSGQEDVDRKATIVIEHLIQASDVSHTMQHWHVYLKWNEKLFQEMYGAYLDGRSEVDPSANWYKGEIGFFDFYLIPLCNKLKECEVFGVSSDEYLNYATANRQEWESKGEDIVKQYLETFHQQREKQHLQEQPRVF